MISDPETIVVNDLGAGSMKMKTSLRKVSDIARYSAVPKKYGIFLSNMSRVFAGPYVLEFGTSLGISTMYMAAACPGCRGIHYGRLSRKLLQLPLRISERQDLSNIRMFNGFIR